MVSNTYHHIKSNKWCSRYPWSHSGELHTLVNQDDNTAPIRSLVRGQMGLWESIPFLAPPPPALSNHSSSSNVRAARMQKSSLYSMCTFAMEASLRKQGVDKDLNRMFSSVLFITSNHMIILMRFGINKCKFEIMKDANAAMTLLEKWPEKIQALNRIQTHDLCITRAMLLTNWAASKPHENGHVWVRPFMFSGHKY